MVLSGWGKDSRSGWTPKVAEHVYVRAETEIQTLALPAQLFLIFYSETVLCSGTVLHVFVIHHINILDVKGLLSKVNSTLKEYRLATHWIF